jgi:hypothetical protein
MAFIGEREVFLSFSDSRSNSFVSKSHLNQLQKHLFSLTSFSAMDTSSTRSSTPASSDAALSVIDYLPVDLVDPSDSLLPSKRCTERRVDGKMWYLLEQAANIRRGSITSRI